MSKRLETLEKLASAPTADAFTWYALAMEYRSIQRADDAVRAFSQVCRVDPNYVPAYMMAGAVLAASGRDTEAASWLTRGIGLARNKGDSHAADEMEQMLSRLRP